MTAKNESWHPVESATEGLFNSVVGKIVDIRNPTEEMIEILSLSTGLANTCRFGGQVREFYSVAQHSLLVCHLAPENLKREALLHDGAEAYLGDVIKPLKVILEPIYGPLEFKFQQVINQKFGLNRHKLAAIKAYDLHALELEHQALQRGNTIPLRNIMLEKGMPVQAPNSTFFPTGWNPEFACDMFMRAFSIHFPEQKIL